MFKTYPIIWLCGLAASGKTTVMKAINKLDADILFLNDSKEILDFIKEDTSEDHHYKPDSSSFVLTDSAAVKYSINQLIAKAKASVKPTLIELSRGVDTKGVVDFSYKTFLSMIPEELKHRSLIVYLHSPFEQRIKRNQSRKAPSDEHSVFESFYCPAEAMNRFFKEDDLFIAAKDSKIDIFSIANYGSEQDLIDKINKLFEV